MLELKDVSLIFNASTVHEKKALDHFSLTIEDGDFITIIGSNGAGKSTLLNAIAGTLEIDEGSIFMDQKDITFMPEHKRANFIGRLFQDPLKGTAPHMSVEENLGLAFCRGKKYNPLSKAIRKKDRPLFKEVLKPLELGLEERLNTQVGLLSGGQRQALTLCMATIVTPKLLLLDEHTAALDAKTSEQVMNITQKIVETHHITTLMITHNIALALKYGNKTLVMNDGKISFMLEGKERKKMSVEKLIQLYSQKTDQMFADRALL